MFRENIFLNKNVDTLGLSNLFPLHILCVLLIDGRLICEEQNVECFKLPN